MRGPWMRSVWFEEREIGFGAWAGEFLAMVVMNKEMGSFLELKTWWVFALMVRGGD